MGSEPFVRYTPVMVTRLMLSLKKAAASQVDGWSFGEPTIRFSEPQGAVVTSDEVRPDTFSNGYAGARSRA